MARTVTLATLPEVQILEDITRESASRVIAELAQYKGIPVALSIFSNGGSVHGSQAIASYIANAANQMQVEARVYGNAASGAMIICAACQRAYISEGSFALIHKAFAVDENGERINMDDLPKEEVAVLDAMNADQIKLFSARSGKSKAAVEKLMDQDRNMPAAEAMEFGLFDGLIPQQARLAAFKTATMSNEKKTRTIKVLAKSTLGNIAAVAQGKEIEVEVDEENLTVTNADELATLNEKIEALTKERDEKAAALAEAEKNAKEAAEATTAKEAELQAAAKDRDAFKAQVETLTKKPAVAQVGQGGADPVVPGAGPAAEEGYKMTPSEQYAADSKAAWEEAKNRKNGK